MPTRYTALGDADLAALDALLQGQEPARWDRFYENRAKPCPFFVRWPDESLAGWVQAGTLRPGRALDLGCGPGRNAVFLASQGFDVVGVDYSATALAWARQQAAEARVQLEWRCQSVFDLAPDPGGFDLVYDSGCFHHLPPHRRHGYVALVSALLRPGGWFGLSCFRPEGGSGYTDEQVYQQRSLGGGLGYTEQALRQIWGAGLQVHSIRAMQAQAPGSDRFGQAFLWALLAQKPAA